MAIITGAHSSFDEAVGTYGNREDLSDVIFDVSPADTPLLSMMGRSKATAHNHEWLVDALASAADNKSVEGNEASATDPSPRSRLANYTQILTKVAAVTGSQEAFDKGGGIKSEMAYQIARRMKEIKKDMEFAMVGQNNAKVAGSESTAAEMGSLSSYLVTNNKLASGSSAPAGNGGTLSDYAGTDRAFDQTILTAGLSSLYTNSGGNTSVNLLCSAATKTVVSGFTNSSTRHVTTDDKKLVSSIDVFVGDFHTVKMVPTRILVSGQAYIIDPEFIKLAQARPLFSSDLGKTGDSIRKMLVWEATLEVCNEKAHVAIGDLSGT